MHIPCHSFCITRETIQKHTSLESMLTEPHYNDSNAAASRRSSAHLPLPHPPPYELSPYFTGTIRTVHKPDMRVPLAIHPGGIDRERLLVERRPPASLSHSL